jgi:hypothetical protein
MRRGPNPLSIDNTSKPTAAGPHVNKQRGHKLAGRLSEALPRCAASSGSKVPMEVRRSRAEDGSLHLGRPRTERRANPGLEDFGVHLALQLRKKGDGVDAPHL